MKKNLIRKIVATLIISLLLPNFAFAKGFVYDALGARYKDDNDNYVLDQWRWIDSNGDGIAECYRFNSLGYLLINTVYNGKMINSNGQWVEDNVVKKMMLSTGKPYGETGTDKKISPVALKATRSLINASGKKDELIQNKPDGVLIVKNVKNATDSLGRIVPKNIRMKKVPTATRSSGITIIAVDTNETTSSRSNVLAGKDMTKYVTTSTNFVSDLESANIYGGGSWKHCMCLKGNGAKVKFNVAGFNFFRMEIAHQPHTEATADTYCYIQVYEDGVPTITFDAFNDDAPEVVEEYIEDETKTLEFVLNVSGDAPGRKVYIQNGRFRKYSQHDFD